ncbi:DUF402 domain-containing protein [Natronospora cellulosivora (SeqCode)]
MKSKIITVKSYKYNNKKHYQWPVTILEENENYLITKGETGRILTHFTRKKEFIFDKQSIEFFSFKEWFTLAININNQKAESYYCNINRPATWETDDVLTFVDLDLDLVKNKGEDWKVVDQDEFEENSRKYNYPLELINRTKKELYDLISRVEKKVFPFDGSLLKYV